MCLHQVLNVARSDKIPALGKPTPAPLRLYLLSNSLESDRKIAIALLKLKCNPENIWSAASLWSRDWCACAASRTGFGDQILSRPQYLAGARSVKVRVHGGPWHNTEDA